MVEVRGVRDELESGRIYPGIDEYFCSEPVDIETELEEEVVVDILPGKYVFILEVTEDEHCKYGKLIYLKKKVGESI